MSNSTNKARLIYQEELSDYLKRNKLEVSDHINYIMLEVALHRDKLSPHTGSFVKSVVSNNLYDAIRYADVECLDHLADIVVVCLSFQIPYNQQKEIEYFTSK
jgi:hypothetical protein